MRKYGRKASILLHRKAQHLGFGGSSLEYWVDCSVVTATQMIPVGLTVHVLKMEFCIGCHVSCFTPFNIKSAKKLPNPLNQLI